MDINLELITEALENNEFFLEYMPIFNLKTGKCIGAETLIRWRYNGEIIPPIKFIPITENTPISGRIACWVIEQVGKELLDWLKQNKKAQISINCPPETVGRGGLWYAAQKAGLLEIADQLIVEITERGIIDDIGIQALHASKKSLKKKVKVAFDDVVIL